MNVDKTAAPVQIHLLGSLRLCLAGQTVPLVASSTATLLGYLALQFPSNSAITRSRLAGTLFPDQAETQARRSLSQALYRLRRLLGEHADAVLRIEGELLSLASVWIDLAEFRTCAASPDRAEWCSAIELYAGDLLEDLDAEWVLGPRASLRELYLATLERTCLTYSRAGELAAALSYAHRWTLADPLREEAHLSQADKNAMGCLYPFSNWRWVSTIPLPTQLGDCFFPYGGFASAFAATPAGGTLWIEPGSYAAVGTYNKSMTLKAPNGAVILGP